MEVYSYRCAGSGPVTFAVCIVSKLQRNELALKAPFSKSFPLSTNSQKTIIQRPSPSFSPTFRNPKLDYPLLIFLTSRIPSSKSMGDGQTVNGQARTIIAVSAVLSALAILVVALRFYTKTYKGIRIFKDDWLILVALVRSSYRGYLLWLSVILHQIGLQNIRS